MVFFPIYKKKKKIKKTKREKRVEEFLRRLYINF